MKLLKNCVIFILIIIRDIFLMFLMFSFVAIPAIIFYSIIFIIDSFIIKIEIFAIIFWSCFFIEIYFEGKIFNKIKLLLDTIGSKVIIETSVYSGAPEQELPSHHVEETSVYPDTPKQELERILETPVDAPEQEPERIIETPVDAPEQEPERIIETPVHMPEQDSSSSKECKDEAHKKMTDALEQEHIIETPVYPDAPEEASLSFLTLTRKYPSTQMHQNKSLNKLWKPLFIPIRQNKIRYPQRSSNSNNHSAKPPVDNLSNSHGDSGTVLGGLKPKSQ